jgi:mannose-6-phosphate isomerase-like protein (cupin superfamily)
LASWTAIHVDEIEDKYAEDPADGGREFRKVRRTLGAKAFGFNHIRLPAGIDGREHDESDSNQEEVYYVIAGSGVLTVDGEEVPLRAGLFVRVDPGATRAVVAGDEGLEFIAIGAPLEGGYEPPSWG